MRASHGVVVLGRAEQEAAVVLLLDAVHGALGEALPVRDPHLGFRVCPVEKLDQLVDLHALCPFTVDVGPSVGRLRGSRARVRQMSWGPRGSGAAWAPHRGQTVAALG